jgi:hypothetical protein
MSVVRGSITRGGAIRSVGLAAFLVLHLAAPGARACTGDCDDSGTVTISELLTGVAIALGAMPMPHCPSLDRDADGGIEVGDLVAGVGFALRGCPPPTATAPPVSTPTPAPTETPIGACDGPDGTLAPLTANCCGAESRTLAVDGPTPAECPQGRDVALGRNRQGFGMLQDCDRIRVVNFAQGGAAVRLNIAARCLDASAPVAVRVRLEMRDRVLIDREETVTLQPGGDGSAIAFAVPFGISGAVRFLDVEGREANLAVAVTDAGGLTARTQLRLVLTAQALADLPE